MIGRGAPVFPAFFTFFASFGFKAGKVGKGGKEVPLFVYARELPPLSVIAALITYQEPFALFASFTL